MSDLKNGTQIVDAVTTVSGPSLEELRRPYQKSMSEIARELKQQQEEAVKNFNTGGSK